MGMNKTKFNPNGLGRCSIKIANLEELDTYCKAMNSYGKVCEKFNYLSEELKEEVIRGCIGDEVWGLPGVSKFCQFEPDESYVSFNFSDFDWSEWEEKQKKESVNMNYMEQVAKMLGVEMEEELEATRTIGSFKFTKDGIKTLGGTAWNELLGGLLTGENEIKRVPKFPKSGTHYLFVSAYGSLSHDIFVLETNGIMRYNIGNFYLNEEDITPEIIEKWKEYYSKPRPITAI